MFEVRRASRGGHYSSGAAGLSDTMTVYNTYGPFGTNLGDVV